MELFSFPEGSTAPIPPDMNPGGYFPFRIYEFQGEILLKSQVISSLFGRVPPELQEILETFFASLNKKVFQGL